MANSVDPDQTASIGTVFSGSTLFASILNLSVMLGNYLQQSTSANDIFRCIFFLGALRVSKSSFQPFPFTPNGTSLPYQLDESISNFRGNKWYI